MPHHQTSTVVGVVAAEVHQRATYRSTAELVSGFWYSLHRFRSSSEIDCSTAVL